MGSYLHFRKGGNTQAAVPSLSGEHQDHHSAAHDDQQLSAYFADFQRLIAELGWGEPAEMVVLRKGIAEPLKDLSYPIPTGWSGYIQQLQILDARLRQREAEKKKTPRTSPQSTKPVIPISERSTNDPSAELTSSHRPNVGDRRSNPRTGRWNEGPRQGLGARQDLQHCLPPDIRSIFVRSISLDQYPV